MPTDVRSYTATNPSQTSPSAVRPWEPTETPVSRRGGTIATYYQAVEQVIATMCKRLEAPMTLPDMAEIAFLSPYHFNRIFRHVTGIPPGRFQAALRLQAAKQLLRTTDLSVTEICLAVGYNSLASFTRCFTDLVGLSPRQFRSIGTDLQIEDLQALDIPGCVEPVEPNTTVVHGTVISSFPLNGLIMIGLFTDPIPDSPPVACGLLSKPGDYQITDIPQGEYYVLAAAFDQSHDGLTGLLHDTPTLVGMSHETIIVPERDSVVEATVMLRPVYPTDPPILVALPYLLNEWLTRSSENIKDCETVP